MTKINAGLPVIKGFKIRATRVGRCGLPLAGPKNTIVTDGFIEWGLERETSDGDEIEVKNASGAICATDRTFDQFKRFNTTLQLCGIHPDLISFFTDQPVVLDADGDSAGLLTQTGGNENAGVALEMWAGTGSGDDCEVPEDDSIFASNAEGEQPFDGWYFLIPWVRGSVLGDMTVNGTDAAEITVTGFTGSGAHWGRGPYDVVRDAEGKPSRLLAPVPPKTHLWQQRTTVKPPENTAGAVALTLPQPYFAAADGGNTGGGEQGEG